MSYSGTPESYNSESGSDPEYNPQTGPENTVIDLTGYSDSESDEGEKKPTLKPGTNRGSSDDDYSKITKTSRNHTRNHIYISSSSDTSSEDSSDDKDVQPKPVRKTASTKRPLPPKELLHIRPGDTVHFWNPFGIAGRSGDMLKEVVREVRSAEAAKGGWVLSTVANNLRTLDETVALPSINPEEYTTLVKVSNYTLHPGKLPSNPVTKGIANSIAITEEKMKNHAKNYVDHVEAQVKRISTKKPTTGK